MRCIQNVPMNDDAGAVIVFNAECSHPDRDATGGWLPVHICTYAAGRDALQSDAHPVEHRT
jgi:hypothetical protein